ncbi:MAG: erythromycin biosynthesis sensory transduction protein eryC1 [Actinobacteria bacterium 13_2_20CM_2_71_6]|nr:MAG: erythromycin biosynthesis sensory transduction protein eryC1 [Actinobacteria bacterium 13_2_20CM_2_71_6]
MTDVKVPLADLRAQYDSIAGEVDVAIRGVLERTDFILGKDVAAFEQEYAQYCETAYAVGLDSGLGALELGMRALGIGPGDEVLTPANSFIASSSAISFTGATPAWYDVDPGTYNIDLDSAARAITPRTKALMVVHLYGQMPGMDAVLAFAREHNLPVVEDACQAHGARWKGKRAGGFGAFAAFSFYPGKNLGAYGDGGALTTDSAELAEQIRMMRNYGQRQKYNHVTLAWNRRLDSMQAAILRVKLRRLDGWNARRREIAARYDAELAGTGLALPVTLPDAEHVYHQYVVRVPGDRERFMAFLGERGIGTGLHYPVPIHLQECYADLGVGRGSFPVTEEVADQIVSLPMAAELSDAQIDQVIEAIRDYT